ncbi:MAG: autotransporter-associated beta strand repeat-containing protein [Thermoguttaceae bacterium]|nr:autotransporter-associated beta strand repeat-containing protein [Thermoguttaceae bacterium]
MAKRTFAIVAVFAALLSVTLSVQAENYNYYWKGGSGNYFTQSKWQLSDGSDAPVPLSSASDVISTFVQADGSTVSFDYSHLGDGVKSLTIGGDNGTVSVTRSSGNTLTVAPNKFISVLDKGTLTVQNTLIINADGLVSVNGGSLSTTGINISGTLDYTSSKNFLNENTINLYDGGTFNLAGSGQFRMNSASAIMNIQGGTATIDNISYIGVGANGVINQSGGTATFNKSLVFGWGNGDGTYNLSAGTLTTTDNAGLWCSKTTGFNTFNMTGGTANFNKAGNSFAVGLYDDGTGTQWTPQSVANVFNLYSGTVNAADTFAIQYGGTLFVAKNGENGGNGVLNAKAITLTNSGNLNMSSGTINVGEGGIASSDNAYTITLSGGTLGTNNASWSSALNATLSNTTTFSPGEGQTITWSGVLSGDGGITKTGAGDLKITAGDSGQAYTGGTTVSAGTLYLTGNNRGYSSVGTGDVTINSGASIVAQSHNVFGSGDGSVMPNVIINGGSLTPNQYLHMKSLEINSGTVNSHGTSGDGLDFSTRNGTITSTGSSSIASAIKNSSTLTIDVDDSELTLSGVLTGSGSISKNGDGTLKLSGTNTFSGGITVNAGKLLITGSSVGTGTTMNKNALIEFAIASGTVSIANNVDNLTNGGKTIKTGAGTLSTNKWISGQVEVQEGTLKLTNGFGSGKRFNGTITIAQGALLDCAAKDTLGYGSANTIMNIYGTMNSSVDNETLNNTELHMYGGTAQATSGSTFDILNAGVKFYSYALPNAETTTVSTISPTLLLRHNGTLPIDTAANSQLNLTGEITGLYNNTQYTCSITKLGDGTLKLSGANSYKGETIVSAGVLELTGDAVVANGLMTVGNNGTLIYNLEEGQSKLLTIDNSNKIVSTGAVEKTGDGTLQIYAASAGQVDASHFLVSSGRLDMKEYYKGTLEVGKKLDEGYTTATFSPGNSVGSLTIDGVFTLNPGSTLLMEQDATGMDTLIANQFNIAEDAIVEYVFTSIQPGATYEIFSDPNGLEGKYADVNYWSSFLTPGDDYYWNITIVGNSVFASVDSNAVPEPSTWALLILGAAGLLYWRKRK